MEKGFSGPRSRSFTDQPGPIEIVLPDLEIEEIDEPASKWAISPTLNPGELVDHRTTFRGVVDQTLPRRHKCTRCYGQGYIPSARHCGAGQPCPDCGGTGKIEPAKIARPATPIGPGSSEAASKQSELLSFDPHFRPRRHIETPQDIRRGDIDHLDDANTIDTKPAEVANAADVAAPWD
jgi:hypothetical protein